MRFIENSLSNVPAVVPGRVDSSQLNARKAHCFSVFTQSFLDSVIHPSPENVLLGPLDSGPQATAGQARGKSVAQTRPIGLCLQGIWSPGLGAL